MGSVIHTVKFFSLYFIFTLSLALASLSNMRQFYRDGNLSALVSNSLKGSIEIMESQRKWGPPKEAPPPHKHREAVRTIAQCCAVVVVCALKLQTRAGS